MSIPADTLTEEDLENEYNLRKDFQVIYFIHIFKFKYILIE